MGRLFFPASTTRDEAPYPKLTELQFGYDMILPLRLSNSLETFV